MKILYLGYYSDITNNRKTAPAADTKMNYIIDTIKKNNQELEVISFCHVNDRSKIYKRYDGYETVINNTKVKYFSNYTSKFRIIRVIGRFFTWLEQKKYIKEKCLCNDCRIIIYHSLLLFKLYKLLNRKNKKFILEVEEIYSDVLNKKKIRKKEIKFLNKADKFIFPTQLLCNVINIYNRPYVLVHGTYNVEKKVGKLDFDRSKIHCVYAGTFDPRKGGIIAIQSAKYLSKKYHIHILGFGTKKEVDYIKKVINEVSSQTEALITYDGLLTGLEYIKFIQNCDIGLSPQNPDATFNATSFPSKILSYMSNGLRVVSIRIPSIMQSEIGNYIYYYDNQTPNDIANAIMNINLNDKYDSRKIIKKLDKKFEKEMENILN